MIGACDDPWWAEHHQYQGDIKVLPPPPKNLSGSRKSIHNLGSSRPNGHEERFLWGTPKSWRTKLTRPSTPLLVYHPPHAGEFWGIFSFGIHMYEIQLQLPSLPNSLMPQATPLFYKGQKSFLLRETTYWPPNTSMYISFIGWIFFPWIAIKDKSIGQG